ncbi:MAG: DUF3175 domain-containing protein [Caulobacteraceae bacterium]
MAKTAHPRRKWSADVTEHSDALDLDKDVFKSRDPKEIARSLKRSAEESHRRKAKPFASAMSMLTFYINRAGDNLSADERRTLEAAKDELRAAFGRPAAKR